MIRTEGDDDDDSDNCVGVAAILALRPFCHLSPLKQLAAHWRKRADTSCAEALVAALQGRSAVLFSERVHNAPPSVAAPLLAILARDLKACATCGDADVAAHAEWDQLLVCARVYVDVQGQDVRRSGAVPIAARGGDGSSADAAAPEKVRPNLPQPSNLTGWTLSAASYRISAAGVVAFRAVHRCWLALV